jgi:hypothetical protein
MDLDEIFGSRKGRKNAWKGRVKISLGLPIAFGVFR